jgi:hypothetical protein
VALLETNGTEIDFDVVEPGAAFATAGAAE